MLRRSCMTLFSRATAVALALVLTSAAAEAAPTGSATPAKRTAAAGSKPTKKASGKKPAKAAPKSETKAEDTTEAKNDATSTEQSADASEPVGTTTTTSADPSTSSADPTAASPSATNLSPGGAAGPLTSNSTSLTGGTQSGDPDADVSQSANFQLQQLGIVQKRWWQVGSVFETHRLIRQDDLGGAARSKALNYVSLYAGIRPTPKDQIRVTGGFTQRFLADGGETGIRADDISLNYNHLFTLPGDVMVRPQVGNSFPISFESRLSGFITIPRASVLVMRNFLDNNLNVYWRGGGSYYFSKYKTALGRGSANPIANLSTSIGANYSMPFHNNLQVGANFGFAWWFNHEVEHGNDPTLAQQNPQNPGLQPTKDPQFAGQPMQQTYGGEVYIGYQLPNLLDTQSNLQLALSQGEATANNVIHDGNTNVYWAFRRSAQVYLALQVQY